MLLFNVDLSILKFFHETESEVDLQCMNFTVRLERISLCLSFVSVGSLANFPKENSPLIELLFCVSNFRKVKLKFCHPQNKNCFGHILYCNCLENAEVSLGQQNIVYSRVSVITYNI